MTPLIIFVDIRPNIYYHLYMIIQCNYCGKNFNSRPSNIKRAKLHFCNKECRKAYYDRKKEEKNKKIRSRNECVNKFILKDTYAIMLINSKTHGLKEVLIDKEKIEEISNIFWHVAKQYENYYCVVGWDKNNKKEIKLHRFLTKCPPNLVVDHINRNPLDNRLENLRCVTHSLNQLNGSTPKNSFSKHKGIRYHYGKYQARIMINKKAISIGHFNTLDEAIKERANFCKKHNIIF